MPVYPIVENDVHLWFLPEKAPELEQLCVAGDNLMAPDEQQRYQSYRHSGRAKKFLQGRVLMRRSLAAHLAVDASELRFSYGPTGKPKLHRAFADELVFSLSHARSSAVMAIARAKRVGVDMEMLSRAQSVLGIARQFFSETERHQLKSHGAAAASNAMALWSLKESIVKASGSSIWEGLSAAQLVLNGAHIKWLSAPPKGPESDWLLLYGRYQTDRALALALQRKHPITQAQKIYTHILGNELASDISFSVLSTSCVVSTSCPGPPITDTRISRYR